MGNTSRKWAIDFRHNPVSRRLQHGERIMQMKPCKTLEELGDDVKRRLHAMERGQANELAAAIINLMDPPKRNHMSDCATSNAPALMPSWCDCGATNAG